MSDEFEFSKRQIAAFNEATIKEMPKTGGSSTQSQIILAGNQALRNNGGAPTDALSWGDLALSIPPAHMAVIAMIYPELLSNDPTVKYKAVMAFLKDPRSEPYRVRTNDGRKVRVY
jgi:hypothetical protein